MEEESTRKKFINGVGKGINKKKMHTQLKRD